MEKPQLCAEPNGEFIFEMFRIKFCKDSNIGIYENPKFDIVIKAGERNFNESHHAVLNKTGVYCFYFRDKNGKRCPFYIGITHQTFRTRFQQHAGTINGILNKFWGKKSSGVEVALIFAAHTSTSKVIESVFLDVFDFAYNSKENDASRDIIDEQLKPDDAFPIFKKSWNEIVHTLHCIYGMNNVTVTYPLPCEVRAENNRDAVISTLHCLPEALMQESNTIMSHKIAECEIFKLDGVNYRYTFDVSSAPNGLSGLYCFYVKDGHGRRYPLYVGYTAQNFAARFEQHCSAYSGALFKLGVHNFWNGCGFDDNCRIFAILVSLKQPAISKFLESIYLNAFNFILNTQENTGGPADADRWAFIKGRGEAAPDCDGRALFAQSWNVLLGSVNACYERKLLDPPNND